MTNDYEDNLLRLKRFSHRTLFHTAVKIAITEIKSISVDTSKNPDPDTWLYIVKFDLLDMICFTPTHSGDYQYLIDRLACIWGVSEAKALSRYLRLLNKTARHEYSLEKRVRLYQERLKKNALRHSR